MYKIIGGDGNEYGPVDLEQIKQWIQDGRAGAQTKVQPEGATEWQTISEVPQLAQLLEPAASNVTPPAFSPTSGVVTSGQRTNPMALTGMIMGILSLVIVCCCYGLPFNLLGIVFSLIGLSQIKASPETEGGKGLALAGLICSIASIAAGIILIIVGVAFSWGDIMKELNQ